MTLAQRPTPPPEDQLRRRLNQLQAVFDLTQALTRADDVDSVYEAALDGICRSLQVDRASILLFDSDRVMRFKAWRGLSDEYRAIVEGRTPWTPETKWPQPVLVEDIGRDADLAELLPVFEREGIGSLACFPLYSAERVAGTVMLYYREPHCFTEEEIALSGIIANHVCFAIDRRRGEVRLAESEARYRALADSLPQMALIAIPDGALTYCNEVWTSYTGLTLEETRAVDWQSLVHPDEVEVTRTAWEKALEAGAHYEVETRVRRHDGLFRWHLGTARSIRLTDGTVDGWVWTATDIHEMKRAQERERFLAAAVAGLADSLDFEATLKSLAKVIVPEFADICSIDVIDPQGEMRRREVQCVDPEKGTLVRQIRIRNWKVGPGASENMRDRLLAGEGVLFASIDDDWIDAVADSADQAALAKRVGASSLLAIPLKARSAVLGSISFVLTDPQRRYDTADMTVALELAHRAAIAIDNARLYDQSRRIAESLKLANQAKDEFLGLVSHEMRTPITTIYGNAQVLKRIWQLIDEKDRASALADIEHDAERLQRIIENMLVLARVEVGHGVATEPVLLNRLINTAVEDMRNRHLSRTVTLRMPRQMLPVVGQPTYLELILRNLMGNAHKYSPLEAPIVVSVEQSGDAALVCVEDAGHGVAEDEMEKIFQPFYRTAHAAAAPGAGMGLAVCRRLVEAQGGTISAHNRPQGGLAVCFRLRIDSSQTH